jgi:pyruvate dehydrogenase E2 component (dihydrolipoamide acetyltransferase)
LPTHVMMPVLGMSQDTGKIVRWLKAEGEDVLAGEMLLEVETDKAVAEIESPANGILARIFTRAGEEVPVAHVIAVIRARDESILPFLDDPKAVSQVAPAPASDPGTAEQRAERKNRQPPSDRPLASPKAKRLARERGIALAEIPGSGPHGAVLAGDVLAVQSAPAAALPAEPAGLQIQEVLKPTPETADRTDGSWKLAQPCSLQREVCAARLLAWQAAVQARSSQEILLTDLLILAAAKVLKQHPSLNAIWQDGQIYALDEVNIGFTVAVKAGLVVPVVRQAGRMRLETIAARRHELVERARADLLEPEDRAGGTFTLSDFSALGIDAFTPGLNGPQAAHLAVGRITDRSIPRGGQTSIQSMMTVTISIDQRAVDSVRGARFMQSIADIIEDPLLLTGL